MLYILHCDLRNIVKVVCKTGTQKPGVLTINSFEGQQQNGNKKSGCTKA